MVLAWFNVQTANLMALPHVPSPTGPSRGDSADCMYVRVCLVWPVFQTAFIVPHHLEVCRQLHTDSLDQYMTEISLIVTFNSPKKQPRPIRFNLDME